MSATNAAGPIPPPTSRWSSVDRWLLVGFAAIMFGYGLVGGRPLTMHEGVLPQSSREMLAAGEVIVPTAGGRPWLERPPLPQWITMGFLAIFGNEGGAEWIVRLPAALAGIGVVLLLADLATRWFGRTIGLLSGYLAATMFQVVNYARLAEEDIYLCLVITATLALFARLEVGRESEPTAGSPPEPGSFFGSRPWPVLGFFLLLGATNLCKGLVFGFVLASMPVAAFLVGRGIDRRWLRYVWAWGWLATIGLSVAWPIAAYLRYPDVLELWGFDLGGRMNGSYMSDPWWYYLAVLPWTTAPWGPHALVGLATTAVPAWRQSNSPARFLWCWAIVPLVVLSIPSGKHHHYMVHCLPAWAILGGVGLRRVWQSIQVAPTWARTIWGLPTGVALLGVVVLVAVPWKLAGPSWVLPTLVALAVVTTLGVSIGARMGRGRVVLASWLVLIASVYGWGYSVIAPPTDQTVPDTRFFRSIPHLVAERPEAPLIVNADIDSMDLFRILFYIGDGPKPRTIHDLTHLLGADIDSRSVHVLTRAQDADFLARLGHVEVVDASERSRREASPGARHTLFLLTFDPGLARAEAPTRVSPMQAMARERGPSLDVESLLSRSASRAPHAPTSTNR